MADVAVAADHCRRHQQAIVDRLLNTLNDGEGEERHDGLFVHGKVEISDWRLGDCTGTVGDAVGGGEGDHKVAAATLTGAARAGQAEGSAMAQSAELPGV